MTGVSKTTKVTLTLRPHIAERLRKMCHAKGVTASDLVDKWIFEHKDDGEPLMEAIDAGRTKTGAEKLKDMITRAAGGRGGPFG